jgi:hypothetical protein
MEQGSQVNFIPKNVKDLGPASTYFLIGVLLSTAVMAESPQLHQQQHDVKV